MFESLVITLREGVEAALVIGVIIAYLRKTGRQHLSAAVFTGLGTGLAASVVCAWLFSRLGIVEEVYEGWLMLIGCLFVVSMVVWMWKSARGLRMGIERRVESIASKPSGTVAAGLFALTFVLILREGVETVLFLAAVDMTTDALLGFTGGLLGLVLAAVFGVALVRGTVRVDIGRFFKVTEIILIVLAAQLLFGGLHEFGELGAIPIGRHVMRIIGPIVKNEVLLMVSLLALPLIVLLVPGRRDRVRAAEALALEGPERRLALAAIRRETLGRRLLATTGILVIAPLTVSFAFSRLPQTIDPPRMLGPADGGTVRIARDGLDDGHLHRFGVAIDGTVVRFIVMHAGSRLVPAFDSCVVCGAHGYIERKGRLICLACAADINVETIGVGGGCNPIPLPYREEGDDLVIAVRDLKSEVGAFREAAKAAPAPPALE
jgi:high-affinity iron transporter